MQKLAPKETKILHLNDFSSATISDIHNRNTFQFISVPHILITKSHSFFEKKIRYLQLKLSSQSE